jgi:UDP-N-acetylglucosamine pyrophosphorylase
VNIVITLEPAIVGMGVHSHTEWTAKAIDKELDSAHGGAVIAEAHHGEDTLNAVVWLAELLACKVRNLEEEIDGMRDG